MNQPPVHALFDPRKVGQTWPEPATWPGIPYVQGMSGGCCPGMGGATKAGWQKGASAADANRVANYLAVKACLDSGPESAACNALEKLMIGNAAAMACGLKALQTAGINGDYCSLSKKKGGRKEDCLAAMLTCPSFKAPSADGSPPAGKSETNWLLWGGVAVVAGFFLLRKK